MAFICLFANIVNYIDLFSNTNQLCIPDITTLTHDVIPFISGWIQFVKILFLIFVSVFMKDFSL